MSTDEPCCRANGQARREEQFLYWCSDNGVEAPALRMATFEQLRGVEAAVRIEPDSSKTQLSDADSVVVRVPERALLSVHTAKVQADNSWAPYLRVLPKDYTILGAFCEDLEDEFQASHAIQSCHRARLCLRQDHSTAQKLLESLELPAKFRSWSAWTFAAGAVATRTMHFPDSDAGCLVPFGDMHNYHPPPAPELPNFPAERLNHTAGEQTDAEVSRDSDSKRSVRSEGGIELGWQGVAGSGEFDSEKREYIIKAGCGYSPGEQVLLCYGRYSNLELLEHYGFLLPENGHDEAVVPPELWPMVADSAQSQRFFFHPGGCPSWTLLESLRRHFCTPVQRSHVANAVRGDMISTRNEAQVLMCISEVCVKVLSGMPTTTKQDQQALAHAQTLDTFRGRCLQLVLKWRIQYKQSLARACKTAQMSLAALKEV